MTIEQDLKPLLWIPQTYERLLYNGLSCIDEVSSVHIVSDHSGLGWMMTRRTWAFIQGPRWSYGLTRGCLSKLGCHLYSASSRVIMDWRWYDGCVV